MAHTPTRKVIVEKFNKKYFSEDFDIDYDESIIRDMKYFEPKRNNRFIVRFPSEFGIEPLTVQKINRPKINFKPKELNIMNQTQFISSNFEWSNFEIELIDFIGPSTSSGVYNLIDFCQDHIKYNVIEDFLFSFSIEALDPVGVVIEKWIIYVKELLEVDFGNYDYSDDSLQKIKITLKPFDCKILN